MPGQLINWACRRLAQLKKYLRFSLWRGGGGIPSNKFVVGMCRLILLILTVDSF